MKATAAPAKRRKGPGVAVLALVACSLLVPLAFLFDRFPSGYVTDERPQQEINLPSFDRLGEGGGVNEVIQDAPRKMSKDSEFLHKHKQIDGDHSMQQHKQIDGGSSMHQHKQIDGDFSTVSSKPKVLPAPKIDQPKAVVVPTKDTKHGSGDSEKKHAKGLNADEVEKTNACQLEFGSYCLWSIEHKEVMKDSIVKRLKDQLFVARSYYPSIAKLKGQEALTHELKQNIQDHERILIQATVDADLPSLIQNKIEKMEQTIVRAKSCTVDCNNVDRKLRQILDMTEDEVHFHMKQSAFLYSLNVHTMPKSHHCLSMRLTVEYFKSSPLDSEDSPARNFNIPNRRHYVIFSKNVLAASVVTNSTVSSSKDPGNMVFHIITDAQNFYAMKHWFTRNSYRGAVVHVINYEDITLENLPKFSIQRLFLPEEFRVLISNMEQSTEKTRMEYLSVFSHSHFFIPEIFKDLKKVIVLDDDIVVQRDLSFLWNLDMGDKVNGAVKACSLRLGQLRNIFGKTIYDPESCAWMSGVNVINLDKWRDHNVTEKYLQLLKRFHKKDEASLRAAALPLSLLSFQHLIYPLDERLTLSGLGYNYGIDDMVAQNSATLHYDGNMKPWVELGILDYKKYWKRFLTRDERFMDECNVHQ